MNSRLFSDAQQLRRPSTGLVREEITAGIRNRMKRSLEELAPYSSAKASIWRNLVDALDGDPALSKGPSLKKAARLVRFIEECTWDEFLDLCTIVYDYLADNQGTDPPEHEVLIKYMNEGFVRHYSAYRFRDDGSIGEPGGSAAAEVIEEARGILSDPKLRGPDRQWQKAVLALEARPKPDFEQAVSEAVNSVEAVAQICVGDDKKKKKLAFTVNQIVKDKGLHKSLGTSIKAISGYAAEAGGRHGVIGAPDADLHIAEYVVHECAAAIVLFARLYGYSVFEPQTEPAAVS